VWIIFFAGAEELEATLASAFRFNWLAPTLPSSMLQLMAVVNWLGSLAYFLVRVFS
jgi:hypothetical protein